MNNRLLGVLAGLVGVVGTLFNIGFLWIRSSLTTETLPGWAVYGTAGASIVTYTSILNIIFIFLTSLLAIASGYYIGRQLDISKEYRRFIGAVATGSTAGVGLTSLIYYWLMNTSTRMEGSTFFSTFDIIMLDIIVPTLSIGSYIAEVALTITIGMFAGAALAQFRADSHSPTDPIEADTGPLSASSRTSDENHSKSQSQS